jgi:hypothetical protein
VASYDYVQLIDDRIEGEWEYVKFNGLNAFSLKFLMDLYAFRETMQKLKAREELDRQMEKRHASRKD